MTTKTKPIELSFLLSARFLKNAAIVPDGCWEWSGDRNSSGYGEMAHRVDGKRRYYTAHRYSYELFNGPLDLSLTIDHTCNNRICCNPFHLEQVTQAENARRAGERQTHCKRGHERNEKNTRIGSKGEKQCRPCCAMLARKYKAAKKSDLTK